MSVTFRPLGTRLYVKPTPRPATTASGLVLPDTWEPETTGTVMALGTAVTRKDATLLNQLKVGDAVVFSWQSGQEVLVEGDRWIVLDAKDVIAVIEGVSA